jgi:hypothetical protein
MKKIFMLLDFSTITILLVFVFLCVCFEVKLFSEENNMKNTKQVVESEFKDNLNRQSYAYPNNISYIELTVKSIETMPILSTKSSLNQNLYPKIRYYPKKNNLMVIHNVDKKTLSLEEIDFLDYALKISDNNLMTLQDFFCDFWGPLISGKEVNRIPMNQARYYKTKDNRNILYWASVNDELMTLEFSSEYLITKKSIVDYNEKNQSVRQYAYKKEEKVPYLFIETVFKKNRGYTTEYNVEYTAINEIPVPIKLSFNDSTIGFEDPKIIYEKTETQIRKKSVLTKNEI